MKQQSNYALRLPKSLKAGIEKAAKADGVSFNQFMVSAAAEKLSALQTAEYFTARAARGSLSRFDEIMARKGFPRVIAHIQERLEGWWTHIVKCHVVGRQTFDFSGYSYLILEIPLPKHPLAIHFESNPYVMIRPEG